MSLISWFDNRTLFACQTLLAIVFTFVFFGVRRTYPELRGVVSVALSFLFGIPGAFLLSSRGALPDLASAVIANTFVFAAFTLLYHGILRFLGNRRPIYPVLIASLLTIAVVAYFTLVRESIVPRIVAISFTIALIRGLIAIELFRHSKGRNTRRLFAISMTVFALMSLNRGIGTLLHGAPANYLQRDSLQTFTLAAGLVSVCLTGIFFLTMCNRHALALVRNESEQDPLSGAFNRRGIEMRLDIELKQSARSGEPLSIALIDVDHFKLINDSVGHAAGDDAIRSVARAISSRLRAYDSLGRFGGDEFLLVLPKTGCTDAQLFVDRLAQSVRASVSSGLDLPLTLSIGLTEVLPDESPETLLARADKALYAAKHAGRNCSRTLLYESPTTPLSLQAQLLAS
jgi:diguanylate cyclase (GGDEF)-like protein